MNYRKRKKLGYDIQPGDPVLQNGFEVWGRVLRVDFPNVTVMWYSRRTESMNIADAQASKQAFLAFYDNLPYINYQEVEEWGQGGASGRIDMLEAEVERWNDGKTR